MQTRGPKPALKAGGGEEPSLGAVVWTVTQRTAVGAPPAGWGVSQAEGGAGQWLRGRRRPPTVQGAGSTAGRGALRPPPLTPREPNAPLWPGTPRLRESQGSPAAPGAPTQ